MDEVWRAVEAHRARLVEDGAFEAKRRAQLGRLDPGDRARTAAGPAGPAGRPGPRSPRPRTPFAAGRLTPSQAAEHILADLGPMSDASGVGTTDDGVPAPHAAPTGRLVMLGGLPGAGKSALADDLRTALPAVVLSVDPVEDAMYRAGIDQSATGRPGRLRGRRGHGRAGAAGRPYGRDRRRQRRGRGPAAMARPGRENGRAAGPDRGDLLRSGRAPAPAGEPEPRPDRDPRAGVGFLGHKARRPGRLDRTASGHRLDRRSRGQPGAGPRATSVEKKSTRSPPSGRGARRLFRRELWP